MLIQDLFEVHYEDVYPQSFIDFRKKYSKVNSYGLYVQFSNYVDNTMDRTAYGSPDHSDPVGVYGYPLDYVRSFPIDVWYGRTAKYLRVLKDKSKIKLRLDSVTERDIDSAFSKIGLTYKDGLESLKRIKKNYKERVTGPNKWAKLLITLIQMDVLAKPTSVGYNRTEYPIRSGAEQTRILRAMGYDSVEDYSKKHTHAAINAREPEQIIFLNRGAFEVVEVIDLRPGVDPKSNFLANTGLDDTERKLIAGIANAMDGDKPFGKMESTSLNFWNYYWTAKGRRIELFYHIPDDHYDNRGIGEKKHREYKLHEFHEIKVKIRSEFGTIEDHFSSNTKYADIIKKVAADWFYLKKNPQVTDWVPETRESFLKVREDAKQEYYAKKREEARQERIAKLPELFEDLNFLAKRYKLPLDHYTDECENLIRIMDKMISHQDISKDEIDEAINNATDIYFTRGLGDVPEELKPIWLQICAITKAAWNEFKNTNEKYNFTGGPYLYARLKKFIENT